MRKRDRAPRSRGGTAAVPFRSDYFHGVSMRRRPTCKEGFILFADAKVIIKLKQFKTSINFKIWAFSAERPTNVPVAPEMVYRSEWKGWGDFLGNVSLRKGQKRRPPKDIVFMEYSDAKILAQSLMLKTVNDFKVWASCGERPITFPSNPDIYYRDCWEGYRVFLGNAAPIFLSLEQYTRLVAPMSLRTEADFRAWAKTSQRPNNAPSNPDKYYKQSWVGWRAFLSPIKLKEEEPSTISVTISD